MLPEHLMALKRVFMKMEASLHRRTQIIETDEKKSTQNGNMSLHNNGTLNNAAADTPSKRGKIVYILNTIIMPFFLLATTPNVVILLWYTATKCDGSLLILLGKFSTHGIGTTILNIWSDTNIASSLTVYVLLGYSCFAILLQMAVPGPRVEGPLTPKGNTPVYKDNGFSCFVITLFALGVTTYFLKQNGLTPTVVYDHFDEFLGTLTIFSQLLCVLLYFKGLVSPSTSDCGSSGNPLFDYYWGTELYPRIFGVDVKVFTNCRFGMTVWPLLCLIFSMKSYELHGFIDSIWVSCTLQMLYFFKFFWWESGYMRTIDIMMDRAGYYICWGCLVWVPGLYASVCMFLVNQPVQLGPFWSLFILTCGILSLIVNYWADEQKLEVRNTNGKCTIWGKKAEIIRAKYQLENGESRESILLTSGFWGVSRHFHYVPELVLAFCWTVPGLGSSSLLYSYFIFLFILLTHRTFRDDEKCGKKYGSYWQEYCAKVPYRMIPYIF